MVCCALRFVGSVVGALLLCYTHNWGFVGVICMHVIMHIIVIALRVPPTLFWMFSVSVELHWVSISLALPLSLLRRARVEPPGISEDLAKQSRG